LYAFVCYRDRTFNYGRLTRDQLRRFVGPTLLTVEVQNKTIEKVVICVVDAVASWFVNGISLPGIDTKMLRRPYGSGLYIENRLAMLENKVDQLFHLAAKGRLAQNVEPDLGSKQEKGKGDKQKKA